MTRKTTPSWVVVNAVEAFLCEVDKPVTLHEVIDDTGYDKTRAYRAMVKLVDRGIVEKLYGHKYAIKKV